MRDDILKGSILPTTDWLTCRLAVRIELGILLLASIALTIAPNETLAALASVTASGRDLALSYRPAVAFVGLLMVGLFSWASIAMWRRRAPSEATVEKPDEDRRDGLRAAA